MRIHTNQEIDWSWHKRAQDCIAQGALTNSKRPECLVKGVYPTHVVSGKGGLLFDSRGRSYIDFICGLGSNLLGYANDEINQAIAQQLAKGTTLSISTELEVETAEKIKECFPFIGKMKILKTGSDACSAAVRIARARTGRFIVLSEGYHGWHDQFVSLTPPALGVPDDESIYRFEKLAHVDETTAAVIIEPVQLDAGPERVAWLQALRARCDEVGALLIFDEVITGFRFPKFSVSEWFGIRPDLIAIGKAMGGGLPISAVGGAAKVMDAGEYFISSTFAGETLSLAAAKKTMEMLQTKYLLMDLWREAEDFVTQFNAIWPEGVQIKGYPTRGAFVGDPLIKALFWQASCDAGIIFGPSFFFAFPHIKLKSQVLSSCRDVLLRVKMGQVQLRGELPSSPFSAKVRGQQ